MLDRLLLFVLRASNSVRPLSVVFILGPLLLHQFSFYDRMTSFQFCLSLLCTDAGVSSRSFGNKIRKKKIEGEEERHELDGSPFKPSLRLSSGYQNS